MEWRIGAKIPEISATLRPAKASVARGRGPLRQPVFRTGRVRPDRADDSKAWWMLRLGLFPRRPDYPRAAHSRTARRPRAPAGTSFQSERSPSVRPRGPASRRTPHGPHVFLIPGVSSSARRAARAPSALPVCPRVLRTYSPLLF